MKKIYALVIALVIMAGVGFGSYLLINRNNDEQATLSDYDVVVAHLIDRGEIEDEDDIGRLVIEDEVDEYGLLTYTCYDHNGNWIDICSFDVDYYRNVYSH